MPIFHAPEARLAFESFLQKISQLSQAMSLNLAEHPIDHLAIRVNDQTEAADWLARLAANGRVISQNLVNGRPIYLIKLHHPLSCFGQTVDVIELPFPKKTYPVTGWEHVEIVMPFNADETPADWEGRILQHYGWQAHPQLSVKMSQPQVDGEQKLNPTIAVSFSDARHNHCCLKVHPYAIEEVIAGEAKMK